MDESKPNQSNMSNTKHPMARLMAAQMDIQAITKDKVNPHFKKNYADINTMLAEVKPALHKHGLFVIQPIEDNQVITQIVDAETGNVLCESALTLSGQGNPQQRGSEITYYRRYTLQSLLAMQADDDDGNAASGKGKAESKPKQPEPPKILDLINEYNNLVEENKSLYTADELAKLNPKADWDEKKYAANLAALKQGIEKRKAAKNA